MPVSQTSSYSFRYILFSLRHDGDEASSLAAKTVEEEEEAEAVELACQTVRCLTRSISVPSDLVPGEWRRELDSLGGG